MGKDGGREREVERGKGKKNKGRCSCILASVLLNIHGGSFDREETGF